MSWVCFSRFIIDILVGITLNMQIALVRIDFLIIFSRYMSMEEFSFLVCHFFLFFCNFHCGPFLRICIEIYPFTVFDTIMNGKNQTRMFSAINLLIYVDAMNFCLWLCHLALLIALWVPSILLRTYFFYSIQSIASSTNRVHLTSSFAGYTLNFFFLPNGCGKSYHNCFTVRVDILIWFHIFKKMCPGFPIQYDAVCGLNAFNNPWIRKI